MNIININIELNIYLNIPNIPNFNNNPAKNKDIEVFTSQ